MKHYLVLVLALVLPILSFAQTKPTQRIVLKNGVTINGTVQHMTDGSYKVTTDTGDTFYFLPSEVKSIVDQSSDVKAQKIAAGNYTGWVIGTGAGIAHARILSDAYYARYLIYGWDFTAGYRFGNFFLGIQTGMGYGDYSGRYGNGSNTYSFGVYGFSVPVLLATRYYFSKWKAQPYIHLATGIELIAFNPEYFQIQIGPGVEIHFSPKISMYIEPLYCLTAPFTRGTIPSGFAAHIGLNFYL